MIEELFRTELSIIQTDPLLADQLWKEIATHYTHPDRHYHNLVHLNNLVEELLPVKKNIADWQTLLFSIVYHDIIYNTLKQNNEEKSAELAIRRLAELNLPLSQREKSRSQILATKKHGASDDPDTNYFTDADLAILGADPDNYIQYTQQIRKEYRFYPDLVYKPGRKKVLRHFLEMKRLFKTDHFHVEYDKQARLNLAAELKTIS